MPAFTPQQPPRSQPLVTWGKAIASQLIVAHHLAHYGPLATALQARWPVLSDWLQYQALLAVQVFIVIGGFLAARRLWPEPHSPRLRLREWPRRVAQRVARLCPVYALALLLAVLAAALARRWMTDPDTPAAPTPGQLIANALMLQDVMGVPALSAGLWYVAIDVQLYALLAGLAGLAVVVAALASGAPGGAPTRPIRRHQSAAAMVLVGALTAASLGWWNRHGAYSVWGWYFFGAYGLGVLAAWGQGAAGRQRWGWRALIAGLAAAALLLEWRSRIALASAVALLLLWPQAGATLARTRLHPVMVWLAKLAYPVFMVHYPVSLVVNAVAVRWDWRASWAQSGALLLAWGLSVLLGWLVWRWVELRPWATRRAGAASPTLPGAGIAGLLDQLAACGFTPQERAAVAGTPAMRDQLVRFAATGGRIEPVAADFSGATGMPSLIRFFVPPPPQRCMHASYGTLAHELGHALACPEQWLPAAHFDSAKAYARARERGEAHAWLNQYRLTQAKVGGTSETVPVLAIENDADFSSQNVDVFARIAAREAAGWPDAAILDELATLNANMYPCGMEPGNLKTYGQCNRWDWWRAAPPDDTRFGDFMNCLGRPPTVNEQKALMKLDALARVADSTSLARLAAALRRQPALTLEAVTALITTQLPPCTAGVADQPA